MDVERQQVELILKNGWSIFLDHLDRLPASLYIPFRTHPRPAPSAEWPPR